MSTELAVVDAEIISAEWNVTRQMVEVVANHICGIILAHPYGAQHITIDGDGISAYFRIPNGLTKAIIRSIRNNPPNRLLSGPITIR